MRLHSKSISKAKHAEFIYSTKVGGAGNEMVEDDDKHDFKPLQRVPGCLTAQRHGQRSEPQTQSEASMLYFQFSCGAPGGFKEMAALALVPSTFTKGQGEAWVTFKAHQRQGRMEWMWALQPENWLIFLARVLGRLDTLSETDSSCGKSQGRESDIAKWWTPGHTYDAGSLKEQHSLSLFSCLHL